MAAQQLKSEWTSLNGYFLHNYDQDTEEWHKARKVGWGSPLQKYMLTASNFAAAVGHSRFKTSETLAYEMLLPKAKESENLTQETLDNFARGKKLEPVARSLFEDKYEIKVQEVGLAIPFWNITIGASADGLTSDGGCIEIKCPNKIYPPLQSIIKERDSSSKIYESKVDEARYRIYKTHYDQMQGVMAITGRKFCYYIVYGPLSKDEKPYLYVEKVLYDHKYWNETLYPSICKFHTEIIPKVWSHIQRYSNS